MWIISYLFTACKDWSSNEYWSTWKFYSPLKSSFKHRSDGIFLSHFSPVPQLLAVNLCQNYTIIDNFDFFDPLKTIKQRKLLFGALAPRFDSTTSRPLPCGLWEVQVAARYQGRMLQCADSTVIKHNQWINQCVRFNVACLHVFCKITGQIELHFCLEPLSNMSIPLFPRHSILVLGHLGWHSGKLGLHCAAEILSESVLHVYTLFCILSGSRSMFSVLITLEVCFQASHQIAATGYKTLVLSDLFWVSNRDWSLVCCFVPVSSFV